MFEILSKVLEVVILWPLRIDCPVNEHGVMLLAQPLPDQGRCPLLICGAPFQVKQGLNLGMDLGQSTQSILIGVPQLTVHSGLGNHRAQVFGHVALIPERAVGPAEHIAG